MTEKKEIVAIDAKAFGLEENKAKQIKEQFQPMLDKMEALEVEYNQLVNEPISEAICAKAKELRLKYVKVRTGTAAIHKSQKEFYLAGGRFVDGWKNAQLFASQGIEDKLAQIENHFKLIEEKRIEDLNIKRIELLKQYDIDGTTLKLGTMNDAVWDSFITGAKTTYEQKKAAEKQAEEARIAKEKAEKVNEGRKKELLDKWQFVPDDKKEIDFSTLNDAEWVELVCDVTQKKVAHDVKQEQIEAENQRLNKEKEDREKELNDAKALQEQRYLELKPFLAFCIDVDLINLHLMSAESYKATLDSVSSLYAIAENKRKKDAEEKIKADAEITAAAEKEKQLQSSSDKDKLSDLATKLESYILPEVNSTAAIDIKNNVRLLLNKTAKYIKDNTNKI